LGGAFPYLNAVRGNLYSVTMLGNVELCRTGERLQTANVVSSVVYETSTDSIRIFCRAAGPHSWFPDRSRTCR